jgi:hypothetical protein
MAADFKRNLVIKEVHILKAAIKYEAREEKSIRLYKLLNKYAVLRTQRESS